MLLPQQQPGELRYAIDAELKGVGLVRYGTVPEGRVLLRHLRQQLANNPIFFAQTLADSALIARYPGRASSGIAWSLYIFVIFAPPLLIFVIATGRF